MKKFLTCLTVLLALTLAVGVGVSNAGNATASNVKVANTLFGGSTPDATTLTLPAGSNTASYTFLTAFPAGAQLLLQATLTGAQFATAITSAGHNLTFQTAALNDPSVTSLVTSTGGAGTSMVQYLIVVPSGGLSANEVGTLTLPVLKGLSALATAGQTVNITFAVTQIGVGPVDNGGNPTATVVTSALPITAAFAATHPNGVPPASNIIDVAQASRFFANTSDPTATGSRLVRLGSLTVANVPGVKGLNGAGTDITISSGDSAAINLQGAFTAAVGSGATGMFMATDAAGSNIVASATPTTGAANLTVSGNKITSGQALYIFMLVDGQTPIDPTTPKATLSYSLAAPNNKPVTAGPTDLMQLVQNGTTRRVFNVPPSTAEQETAFIRITNTSSIDGQISATLTLLDGTQIGPAVIVPTLAHGATAVFSSAQLENVMHIAPFSGRARLTVQGLIPSMEVMGTLRNNATGVLVNMSSMAIE